MARVAAGAHQLQTSSSVAVDNSGVDRRYCRHLVAGAVCGGGGVQGALAGGAGEASPVVAPAPNTQPLSLVHWAQRSERIRQRQFLLLELELDHIILIS